MAESTEKRWINFQKFLSDIHSVSLPRNFTSNKYPDVWCNRNGQDQLIPLTIETKEVHVYYNEKGKRKRFTTTKSSTPTVQLSEKERNTLRTEYEFLANGLLKRHNPYDFLCRLFPI